MSLLKFGQAHSKLELSTAETRAKSLLQRSSIAAAIIVFFSALCVQFLNDGRRAYATPDSEALSGRELGVTLRPRSADAGFSTFQLMRANLAAPAQSVPIGWSSIPNTRFRDVMPEKYQTEWGVVGPKSVLIAWNNLAFDGEALYAHGGGHADYGGNEVYRFSLRTLKWERITEPSPYPPRTLKNSDDSLTSRSSISGRCPPPTYGPPSSHTYDGKFVTGGKLWVLTIGIAFCPSGAGEIWYGGLWSLDLVTKQWTRVDPPIRGFPLTAVLPNGTVYIGDRSDELIYNPLNGNIIQYQGGYASEGDGSAVYDSKRNRVWITNRHSTAYIPLTKDFKFGGKRIRVLPKKHGQPAHVGGISFAGANAIDPASGRFIRWGGNRRIVTYTPETDKWEIYDFPSGPDSKGPLYDRLFPLPGHDGIFIAVSNNIDENVWLLKMPTEPGTEIRLDSGP